MFLMKINRSFKLATLLSLAGHILALALLLPMTSIIQPPATQETSALTLVLLPPQTEPQKTPTHPSVKKQAAKYLARPTAPSTHIAKEQSPPVTTPASRTEDALITAPALHSEALPIPTGKTPPLDTSINNTAYWAKELTKNKASGNQKKTLQSALAEQNKKPSVREQSEKELNKAVRDPCSQAYMSFGLIAIPFLLKDTVTNTGCVW